MISRLPILDETPTEEWINVEYRLPDFDEYVLWYREDGIQFIDEIDHGNDWQNFSETHEVDPISETRTKVTHWMPLPSAPDEKQSKP